jgi:aldehyde:ferredoxin oxidoreductase
MGNYKKVIIKADLGKRTIERISPGQDILRQYIGGSGLASRFFLDAGNAASEPFSKDNNLYIMTGPLTGTKFPGTGRFSAASRSPLTGIWGESNCGGNFGPELKFAGYDGIIVSGASPDPVYLLIEDDDVKFCDASGLWGRDAFEVLNLFRTSLHGKKHKVLGIGQAGENLVRYASIINDTSDALGRTGLGSVMGAKKLKAIVVRGSGKTWRPSRDSEYDEFIKSLRYKLKGNAFIETMHKLGTNAGMVVGRKAGDIPTKNWTVGESNEYAKPLLPYNMLEKYFVRHQACFSCPVGCKKEVEVKEGIFKTPAGPAPEYETFGSFGTMLLIKDMDAIIKIHNLCNRYGMDVISCGSTIAFAMECYEKGLITKKDTDGLELKWGDGDVVVKMLHKIALREGIGDLLAEGSRLAAEKIGKSSEDFTVEVKGLELPMHDPRAFHGHGLSYVTSPRGACHVQHLVHFVETNNTSHPELGLDKNYDRHTCEGKAKMTAICDNYGAIMNAAPMCQFVFGGMSAHDVTYMLRKSTGFDYDLEEIKLCGERLWYLKRVLNNFMGAGAQDDRLPKKVMQPFTEGGTKGSVPDMNRMLKEYYEIRKLDNNGVPSIDKLRSLDLFDLVEEGYNLIRGKGTA